MVQATEGEQPVMKLINRHKREKFVSVTFQGQNSEAPSEPPAEITKHLDTLPAVSIQKLRDLFEKRPAWTRLAISNNLTAAESKDFKLLLPTVAYVINSGPWRDCWVRYGYDPRKHKDAHLYQIIDFRNISQPGKHISKRAVRLRGIGDSSERVGQKIQTDNDRERSAKR